jgi:hypothetical protein
LSKDLKIYQELKNYDFLAMEEKLYLQDSIIKKLKAKLVFEQKLRLQREKELEEVLSKDNLMVSELESRLNFLNKDNGNIEETGIFGYTGFSTPLEISSSEGMVEQSFNK